MGNKLTRVWFYFWKKYFTETKKIKLKLHWKGNEYLVDKVDCTIPCNSKVRKSNPIVIMETRCSNIRFHTIKENGYKRTVATIT